MSDVAGLFLALFLAASFSLCFWLKPVACGLWPVACGLWPEALKP